MLGMVSGGSQEEGVPDGLWTPFEERRDQEWFDPWDTPLLDSGTTEENKEDSVPLWQGPWGDSMLNPFKKEA